MPSIDHNRRAPLRVLMSCSAGAVDDPGTWSGTPYALFSALSNCDLITPLPMRASAAERWINLARKIDRHLAYSHPSVEGPLSRLTRWRAVAHHARALHCDASLHLGTYDLPMASQAKRPAYLYIDTTYDLWRQQSSRRDEVSIRLDRRFRKLERHATSAATHIFAIGDHVAENLMSEYHIDERKLSVVGTGRGKIAAYDGPKDFSNGKILSVAKVRPDDKGIPLLLAAFARAHQLNPTLSLTVVGGQKIPGIARMPGVQATGWLSDQELQTLFENASLFVMPARYEPWGLAYLEALSCQVPIMGLSRNAFPQLSAHGQHGFVTQNDPDALAQDILKALADPVSLAQMGRLGFDFATRYSWERTAQIIARQIAADGRI